MDTRVKKRLKRITAFLMAVMLTVSNINFGGAGIAQAAVLTADEAEDMVTITHELVSEGREAEITVCEATPDIRITNVRMVRGNGIAVATGSEAIKATASEAQGPGKDKPENPQAATPSEPQKEEEAVTPPAATPSESVRPEEPEETATATPSQPQKEETVQPPTATPSESEEKETDTDTYTDTATSSQANGGTSSREEDNPVMELAQGDSTWRFLVNENRTYRFKITYQTVEDNKLVKRSVSVDYEVDDILEAIEFLDSDTVKIISTIHGQEDGKSLEIPLDRQDSGRLSIAYSLPADRTGRFIKLGFPTGIKILDTDLPKGGVVDKCVWKTEDSVKYLYIYFTDETNQTVNVELPYKTNIYNSYAATKLSDAELKQYIDTGLLELGSFTAQGMDDQGSLYGEDEIGPLFAEKVTGGAGYSVYGAPYTLTAYASQEWWQRNKLITDKLNWRMGSVSWTQIYSGYQVAVLRQLKIYAPKNLIFDISEMAEIPSLAAGSDENGSYMTVDLADLGTGVEGFLKTLRLIPEPDKTLVTNQTYQGADAQLTYYIYGEEMHTTLPLNLTVTIGGLLEYKDQMKLTSHGADYPNCSLIFEGSVGFNPGNITISNTFEPGVAPKSKGEGAKLMVDYPYELRPSYWTGAISTVTGPEPSEIVIKEATASLSNGEAVSCKVTFSDSRNFRITLTGNLPQDVYVKRLEITFSKLLGGEVSLRGPVDVARVDQNGDPYPPDPDGYGQEVVTRAALTDAQSNEGLPLTDSNSLRMKGVEYKELLGLPPINSLYSTPLRADSTFSFTQSSSSKTVTISNVKAWGEPGRNGDPVICLPEQLKDGVMTLTYPYELRPDTWTFKTSPAGGQSASVNGQTINLSSVYGRSAYELGSLRVWLDDGSYEDYPVVNDRVKADIPDGRRVVKTELHIKDLEGYNLHWSIAGRTSMTKEDGRPFQTETLKLEGLLTYEDKNHVEKTLRAEYGVGMAGAAVSMSISSNATQLRPEQTDVQGSSRNISLSPDAITYDELKGGTLTLEYPWEVRPYQWTVRPSVSSGTPAEQLGDATVYFTDIDNDADETQTTVSPNGTLYSVTVPEGKRVVRFQVTFKGTNKISGVSVTDSLQSTSLKKDGTPFGANSNSYNTVNGKVTIKGQTTQKSQDIPYYLSQWGDAVQNFSISNYSNGQADEILINGFLNGSFTVSVKQYYNGLVNHMRIEVDPETAYYCNGSIQTYNQGSTVSDWTIHYKTSMGVEGNYVIPRRDTGTFQALTFYNLREGERFEEISVQEEGRRHTSGSQTLFALGYFITRADLEKLPYAAGSSTLKEFTSKITVHGVEDANIGFPESQREYSASLRFRDLVRWTINSAVAAVTVPESTYQTQSIPVTLSLGYNTAVDGSIRLPYGRTAFYVEWKSPRDLAFSGLFNDKNLTQPNSQFKGSLITLSDGSTWLKIEPRYRELTNMGTAGGRWSPLNLNIKATVLPGAKLQSIPVTGRVYADVKEYKDTSSEELLEKGVTCTFQNLLPDTLGLCQDGAETEPRMIEAASTDSNITIYLKNLTGVVTTLGVEGNYFYGESQAAFLASQRNDLNTLLSISSKNDDMQTYQVTLALPRQGREVSYLTEDGNLAKKASGFDIRLQAAPGHSKTGGSTNVTIRYQLEGMDQFVTESEVSDWGQVDRLQIEIENLPAQKSLNVFLNLAADVKVGTGNQFAYMAPNFNYTNSAGGGQTDQYGKLATFRYGDYQISGMAWKDNDEDGIRENGEPPYSGLLIELWSEDQKIGQTVIGDDGVYQIETHLSDNLTLKAILPDSQTQVLTVYRAPGAAYDVNSDFDRLTKTAVLPEILVDNQEHVDVGIVDLPELTAQDIEIKSGLSGQAQVNVKYGAKPAIHYEEAQDIRVATVAADGLITAVGGQGERTRAKVWVVNSLGDRVEAEYIIRILSNNVPVITAHDWKLVEGDAVADWWDGVECDDPEDTWISRMIGWFSNAGMVKSVTFHRESSVGEDSRIEPEEALAEPGTCYVRYSAVDTDGNEGADIKKLTVYGKLESRPPATHHMAAEDGPIQPEENLFYYLEEAGGEPVYVPAAQVEVSPAGASLETAGQQKVIFTAVHPKQTELTTGGVTIGDGRSSQTEDTYQVDSRPEITGAENRVVLPGQSLELLDGVSALYIHYEGETGVPKQADLTVTDPEGTLIEGGHYTAPMNAGSYRLTYNARAGETYGNGGNTSEKEVWLTVCGTVEIRTPEVLYLTPEEAGSGSAVWNKLRPEVEAWYEDPDTGENLPLQDSGITHTVVISDETGMASEVRVRAKYVTAGITIWSETAVSRVVIRNVPRVDVQDVHMRQGERFDPEEGVSLMEADPEEKNVWSVSGAPVNTGLAGKYELTYRAEDQLTGAHTDTRRSVYVHGNPQLTVLDASLFTHQSTGEEALIHAVRQSAGASIQYVEADGTIRTVSVPGADLSYEIDPEEGYSPETEGAYHVTVRMNDGVYIPAGVPLEAAEAEQRAVVLVSNKLYEVKFSTNNDAAHHKGEFEDGAEEVTTNAVHGSAAARVPVPKAMEGYRFDGYKALTSFTTTDDLTLGDGTAIAAGSVIPAGSMLTMEQVAGIKIYQDVWFQAAFSAVPVMTGKNVILYENEEYKQDQLCIQVTDGDGNANPYTVDDAHVDTSVPGTYQIKVTGNGMEIYLYVQVVGKTRLITIPDLHTRKGTVLAVEQLVEGVEAVYSRPLDIPQEPWPDTNKSNNGTAAAPASVQIQMTDTVDTDTIGKTRFHFTAPGMVTGREADGGADGWRDVYVHGLPVVTASDNGLYTHQSTDGSELEQVIHSGRGRLEREAARAYVEYVQPDGSIRKVVIDPEEIHCDVQAYVPLTEGDYQVMITADDSSVLSQAQATGLTPASGESSAVITVADRLYAVTFQIGEHGSLKNPEAAVTAVAHGRAVKPPALALEEGYELDSWTDENGKKVNLPETLITRDRAFTGSLKVREFTVRFIGKNNRVIKTETVKYGQDATPPTDDRDVTNKRFDGWSKSYRNVKSDMDIFTTYWKPQGGGPNGGGGYVPSGPGINQEGSKAEEEPLTVFSNIDDDLIPKGVVQKYHAAHPGQSIAGTLQAEKAGVGYQPGTVVEIPLTEEVPLTGGQMQVISTLAGRKKCILHLLLFIIAAFEGIYLYFKRKRDQEELEKLRKQKEGEEESDV